MPRGTAPASNLPMTLDLHSTDVADTPPMPAFCTTHGRLHPREIAIWRWDVSGFCLVGSTVQGMQCMFLFVLLLPPILVVRVSRSCPVSTLYSLHTHTRYFSRNSSIHSLLLLFLFGCLSPTRQDSTLVNNVASCEVARSTPIPRPRRLPIRAN
ncbi:hypothetical protein EV127DRAFT_239770 [Xylaria flabelliformis]|nr:hypothetical protein EV127DRAFT_239770 [Xylaria flabelliformis]